MSYKIEGRVISVSPEQNPSQSFRFRELVIQHNDAFAQEIAIQFTQDRADLITGVTPKADVRVSFSIRSKKSPDGKRFYTSLQGYNIEKL